MFKALNYFQLETLNSPLRLAFALLGYGTLIFLWRRQSGRKRSLTSSRSRWSGAFLLWHLILKSFDRRLLTSLITSIRSSGKLKQTSVTSMQRWQVFTVGSTDWKSRAQAVPGLRKRLISYSDALASSKNVSASSTWHPNSTFVNGSAARQAARGYLTFS